MLESVQPLSTSIIATVRRDAVSLGTNGQQNQAANQSAQKSTDNVFRLQPKAEPERQQPDFVVSNDSNFQAQAAASQAQESKLPANAFSYANAAYRLASSFTAFPAFSQLNFAV